MRFPEDDFDLKSFKDTTVKNRATLFREKHAVTMRVISIIIALAAFVAAFVVYDLLNVLIEQFRLLGFIPF